MKKYVLSLIALFITIIASADTTEYYYYKGDINNDNEVDIQDAALLIKVLNNQATANKRCDLDDDNDVDLDDLKILVDLILQNKKEKVILDEATIPSGTGDTPTIVESKGATFKEAK